MRVAVVLFLFIINLSAYVKTTDTYNVYFTSEHFRVIVGISYENNSGIADLATLYLDSAETVWNKEVVTLAFNPPKNSQSKIIDIYVGNRSAYNYESNTTETISVSYAGYATEYPSDRTPFFVLNPLMSSDQVRVTIAHEFFHTVQFSYIDESQLSDNEWRPNIWWMEATAVLLEDEVYDDINDYIRFLNPFFTESYRSFELYDGWHEYSMVIFAKYLKEKFGMGIIKETLLNFDVVSNNNFFNLIDMLLQTNYNSSMKKELHEFAKWVADAGKYFEEGSSYPELMHYSSINRVLGKGGILVVDNLSQGWNMVTLSTSEQDVNSSSKDTLDIVWSYANGVWKNSVQNEIVETNSSQGYWVLVSQAASINYTYNDVSDTLDISKLDGNWHLLGTTKTLHVDTLSSSEKYLVWYYTEGGWKGYSNSKYINDLIIDAQIPTLETLSPSSSYWIIRLYQ